MSPEDEIDLTSFTRALMARMESDLGMRLRWGAVNHHDPDNPHAHLVIRGVDLTGQQVWILTEELGPRPEHVIDRQLDREVGQERLTSVDRRLAAVLAPDQTTDLARLASKRDPRDRNRLVGRLQKLEQLRLVARTTAGS